MASPFDAKYNSFLDRLYYYADRYGIDRNVGVWQLWAENKFKSTGCSGANACGPAQFIPATAARYGVNLADPEIETDLNGWAHYMRDMLDMFGGRYDIALAGYNSGENYAEYKAAARENRAINWSVMPARVQGETKAYVTGILANAGTPGSKPLGSSSMYLWLFGFAALYLLIDD